MRVVFMGTPAFAVPSLESLSSAHDVVTVYTQPDRPRGRGRELTPSPVKECAARLDVPVRQPLTLRDPDESDVLRDLAPDVICVAAYGLILPPEVLAIPPHGCINVHASLLPRHRGAAPVHRAILDGDRVTGVSIMRMEEGLDTGPYALQAEVEVGERTVGELEAELARLGAESLLKVLSELVSGDVRWKVQDDSSATYAAKVSRDDVALHPGLTVEEVRRRVRASTSSAPCRACVGDRTVTVLSASATTDEVRPGHVRASKDALLLGLADGAVRLDEIRPEGRACMDGACFARGAHIDASAMWTACQ